MDGPQHRDQRAQWTRSAASPTCPANKTLALQLPRAESRTDDGLCKCRPICKNRRRVWKGQQLETSAEKLQRERPDPECGRRWRSKLVPSVPCPLLGRALYQPQDPRRGSVVRICEAPLGVEPPTPYLHFVEFVKRIGADAGIKAVCSFCECGSCCDCARGACAREYAPRDPERVSSRRAEMRAFDARVREHPGDIRAMYEIPDE